MSRNYGSPGRIDVSAIQPKTADGPEPSRLNVLLGAFCVLAVFAVIGLSAAGLFQLGRIVGMQQVTHPHGSR